MLLPVGPAADNAAAAASFELLNLKPRRAVCVDKERRLSYCPNEKEIFWSLFIFHEIVGHGDIRTCHYGSKYFYDNFL